MEYILSLIVCVYCVIHFDIFERRNNRKLAYRWLLIWFIVLSGFQYMVGIDIVSYVKEYQTLNTNNLTWKDITEYHVRYQPGWMLLCYICRFITSDYVLIKMIQAIFLNVAIFSFFKKHSQYLFTSILLYAISDYLVLNFQCDATFFCNRFWSICNHRYNRIKVEKICFIYFSCIHVS